MKLERLDEDYGYLVEMAEVDRISLGGQEYIVDVFADEGDYKPHFHLHPKGSLKKSDEILIRIDVPEYFLHGVYRKTLNSKERKELVTELSSVFEGDSLWEAIRKNWNRLHRDRTVHCDMPNYEKLLKKSS